VDVVDEHGTITKHALLASLGGHPRQSLEQCLERDMYWVPSTVTIRKSVFEELGGFNESLRGYEDEELFVRLFSRAPVLFIPETLVRWRQYPGQTSRGRRFFESRILYLRNLLATFPDQPEKGEYLASRCIAPRFFGYYRDDYLSALDGHGPDIAPDELRRGMLTTLPYLPRLPWSLWLLAHVPFRLAQAYRWLGRHLPLSRVREIARPSSGRR
jgi:hypothetical protein